MGKTLDRLTKIIPFGAISIQQVILNHKLSDIWGSINWQNTKINLLYFLNFVVIIWLIILSSEMYAI